MSAVCGIDAGSLRTLSYVAWLHDGFFDLDVYTPTAVRPLPGTPRGHDEATHYAIDAPQGLPALDRKMREADLAANAPAKVLPHRRDQFATWRLYRGLIECGVEMFWAMHERGFAHIEGLGEDVNRTPTAMETYPRLVIRRLWPRFDIPSKRVSPFAYVDTLWGLLRERGYDCRAVVRPTVDQVDAMLCAIAAEAASRGEHDSLGLPPVADTRERVMREGYIVVPKERRQPG